MSANAELVAALDGYRCTTVLLVLLLAGVTSAWAYRAKGNRLRPVVRALVGRLPVRRVLRVWSAPVNPDISSQVVTVVAVADRDGIRSVAFPRLDDAVVEGAPGRRFLTPLPVEADSIEAPVSDVLPGDSGSFTLHLSRQAPGDGWLL